MRSKGARRDRLAAAGLILLCALVLFFPVLFLGETFVDRDLRSFHGPLKALVAPLWRASHGVPLWNPFIASGQPFAANPQHAVFFPLTWLFLVLPFDWAFRLQVVLPVLAHAAGMLALLRALGRSPLAALFGAVSWGFGGYVVSLTNALPLLLTSAPLPWALSFVVRTVREGRPAHVAGLALSIGLMGLGGEPATLLETPVLLLAAAADAWTAHRSARQEALRGAGRLALAGALGLAISAAAILPAFHHVGKTVRATALEAAESSQWSFPPVRLAELIEPHALGHTERTDERWFWGAPLYSGRFPFIFSIYCGLLVPVLAFLAWSRRRALAWGAATVAGFLWAAGSHLPFGDAVRRALPLVRSIRYPEKAMLVFLLPLCVAAAVGLDLVLHGRRGEGRGAARATAGLGAVAAAGAAALLLSPALSLARTWTSLGAPGAIAPALGGTLARDLATLAATALLAALFLTVPTALGRRRAGMALVALCAADLLVTFAPCLRTLPAATEGEAPPLVQRYRGGHAAGPLFHFAAWTAPLMPNSRLVAPPMPARWAVPTTLESDYDDTQLLWGREATLRTLEIIEREPALGATLLSRRGVGAVARLRPAPSGRPTVQTVFVRTPRPFAACVPRLERFTGGPRGWQEALRRLGRDSDGVALVPAEEAGLPGRVSPGEARIESRSPDRLRIVVHAAGPAPSFLQLEQTWDDGWSATVDDRPVRLVRSDLCLTGLPVPAGDHRVELRYGDPWVAAGVWISATALLALAVVSYARTRTRFSRG